MTTKKLTRSSAITIPKELRTKLGWGTGIAIDIEAVGDGSLVIRPHVDRCRFCGAFENVHRYKDIFLCTSCADEMKEVI